MRNLPELPGYAPVTVSDFDREHWTTCRITRLVVGDVFAFRAERHRPAVLEAVRAEDVPGDEYGLILGVARYLGTGDAEEFNMRGNVSILIRCDMHYEPSTPARAAH